jgi:hypothetical protein
LPDTILESDRESRKCYPEIKSAALFVRETVCFRRKKAKDSQYAADDFLREGAFSVFCVVDEDRGADELRPLGSHDTGKPDGRHLFRGVSHWNLPAVRTCA